MNRHSLIVIFVLISGFAVAQQKNLHAPVSQFDKLIAEQFKPGEPGATALIARNGQVIYKKATGMANLEMNVPMKTDHIFRIGSITKQFTAVAILQLMEQGKLNLQDEITKYIPGYPAQGNRITIEHLLTHTSGIRNYSGMQDSAHRLNWDVTPVEMIDYFKNEPLRFTPGTKWEYSNSGYFLLGYIIEKISGKTYGEYLEENIFIPLEMSNSGYASDIKIIGNRADGYSKGEKGFENAAPLSMTKPYAAGSILSTVEDLFKWQQGVQSYKLIRKETLEKAFTRYKLIDGKETDYGYGWRMGFIQDSPSLWHGGLINGFIAMAIYLPKEDVFVTVLSNCDCNSPEDLAAKLAAAAIGKPYEYKEIKLENSIIAGYEGVYENEKGLQKVITMTDNKLFFQQGRGPKAELKAYKKDHFFFADDVMLSIEFANSAAGGEVEKLIFRSRKSNTVWNKTSKAIPTTEGIQVDEKILSRYTGAYEVTPEFTFTIVLDQGKLFLQATGQEKIEMFAETENKFFLKVNDAQLEFVNDGSGNFSKVMMTQSGRSTDAKRIK